jgi:DNA-binding NarL/FixJ family response regulator
MVDHAVIRVAVVEDHPVYRQGLAQVIEDDPALELTLAADSIEDFDAHARIRPDVVILDLGLPGKRYGTNAVRHLCKQGHRVLIVSAEDRQVRVLDAIAAGASGYLTKTAAPSEIIAAVTSVAAGETYVSATLAGHLLKHSIKFTPREKEVLRLVASGETDRDIAEQLFVSVRTVHGHLEEIRAKMGCHNRTQLAVRANELGIISDSPKRP